MPISNISVFYVAIAKVIHLVVELEEDNQTSHLHDTFIPDLNQLGTINTLFFSSGNDILETDIHTDFVVIIPPFCAPPFLTS